MSEHDQCVQDYERDGVVRIRRFFSQERVAEIRVELDRYTRDDLPSKPADARTLEADGKTSRNLGGSNSTTGIFGISASELKSPI